ncbi:dihydroneopterin aldolase [Domibacillus epiphyticus]|uniref:7,8-dihydroneopterin aldolase n=1 Tax=Domibacillus epiphyticus TaxID=1714355 RepID=A0A1V2A740_9BACI|nr:dihydroneopterin aldolase [Domibacillus epiphyticus]OMP66815.1 dihydroneopterin aldolase [Domibacillus epiphyticus]
MDKIFVTGMEFYGYHGVFPEENKLGQRFRADVTVDVSLKKAGETDDLDHSVNYAEIYEICKRIMEGKPVNLVETLAERIAGNLLDSFEQIRSCTVKVIKPDPPIAGHYDFVAIEITRGRGQ